MSFLSAFIVLIVSEFLIRKFIKLQYRSLIKNKKSLVFYIISLFTTFFLFLMIFNHFLSGATDVVKLTELREVKTQGKNYNECFFNEDNNLELVYLDVEDNTYMSEV